jgi:hypothetical protein
VSGGRLCLLCTGYRRSRRFTVQYPLYGGRPSSFISIISVIIMEEDVAAHELQPPERQPIPSLHDALRSLPTNGAAAALEALRAIVRARPEAIRERDHRGCLPLHAALALKKSLRVVAFLVQAGSDAPRDRMRDEINGGMRWLPLQLAAVLSPVDVIQFLVDHQQLQLQQQHSGDGDADEHGGCPRPHAASRGGRVLPILGGDPVPRGSVPARAPGTHP